MLFSFLDENCVNMHDTRYIFLELILSKLQYLLVDNPARCGKKITKMFYKNIKVLLFEDEEYKGPIFENYHIGKFFRAFM
jgi:hypothetical protein